MEFFTWKTRIISPFMNSWKNILQPIGKKFLFAKGTLMVALMYYFFFLPLQREVLLLKKHPSPSPHTPLKKTIREQQSGSIRLQLPVINHLISLDDHHESDQEITLLSSDGSPIVKYGRKIFWPSKRAPSGEEEWVVLEIFTDDQEELFKAIDKGPFHLVPYMGVLP